MYKCLVGVKCRKTRRPERVIIFEGAIGNYLYQRKINDDVGLEWAGSAAHFLTHMGLKCSVKDIPNLVQIYEFLEKTHDDDIKKDWINARFGLNDARFEQHGTPCL